MSSRVKILSIEEMKARRKAKRAKGKDKVESSAEPKESQERVTPEAGDQGTIMGSIEASQSKKRKALFDPEEDPENVLIKIPHRATAIADSSSLTHFVGGLLLEKDEARLRD